MFQWPGDRHCSSVGKKAYFWLGLPKCTHVLDIFTDIVIFNPPEKPVKKRISPFIDIGMKAHRLWLPSCHQVSLFPVPAPAGKTRQHDLEVGAS